MHPPLMCLTTCLRFTSSQDAFHNLQHTLPSGSVFDDLCQSRSSLAVLSPSRVSRTLAAMARTHGALTRRFRPSVLPGQDRKDLATPRRGTATGRRRVARRAKKQTAATSKKQQASIERHLFIVGRREKTGMGTGRRLPLTAEQRSRSLLAP